MTTAGQNPLQARIKARLKQDAYFAEIPIITVDEGDIVNEIEQKTSVLAGDGKGASGVCLTILTPEGANNEPHSTGVLLTLAVEVSAIENVLFNRGPTGIGKPAYEAIRRAMEILAGWSPGPPFLRLFLKDFKEGSVKINDNALLVYPANFECSEALR